MYSCVILTLCFSINIFIRMSVSMAIDDNEVEHYRSFCSPLENNGECSENFNCRCSTIIPSGEHVCTLQADCSSALPCHFDGKCGTPDLICVKDNRCNGQHLCYSLSLATPDVCSPLAINDNINNEE